MILVLVGPSASGKTTLANLYCKRNKTFHRVVTYTTRPMRPGERDGVDYHFITKEEFWRKVRNNEFLGYAQYRDWYYGTGSDLDPEDDLVAVLTPSGARRMKKRFPDSTNTAYLAVERRSRLMKMLQRGDNVDEAYRRNLSDEGQFDGFEDEADLVLQNHGYKKSPESLCDKLRNFIEVI